MAGTNYREAKQASAKKASVTKDFTQHKTSLTSYDDDDFDDTNDVFTQKVDDLTEKSSVVRQSALLTIASYLQNNIAPLDQLESSQFTLVDNVKRLLRGKINFEQITSCKIIALLSIALGTDSEELSNNITPVFESIITTGCTESLATEIFKAWGMVLFINGDTEETLATLDKFIEWATQRKFSDDTIAAILSAFSFCTTALPISVVTQEIIPTYSAKLAQLMKKDSLNVKLAACQSLVLLIDFQRASQLNKRTMENNFDVYDMDEFFDVTALLEDVEEATKHRNASASKEEQKLQRTQFKQYHRAINDGHCPEETISIKKTSEKFSSWNSIIKLEYFRYYLQTGFLEHFASNDLLHQVFEIDSSLIHHNSGAPTKKAEKEFYSDTFKARSKDKRKNQRKAAGEFEDE